MGPDELELCFAGCERSSLSRSREKPQNKLGLNKKILSENFKNGIVIPEIHKYVLQVRNHAKCSGISTIVGQRSGI